MKRWQEKLETKFYTNIKSSKEVNTMAKKSCASNPMTPDAASRIQSANAKANGGVVSKGSFASRSQSAAAKNVNNGCIGKKK